MCKIIIDDYLSISYFSTCTFRKYDEHNADMTAAIYSTLTGYSPHFSKALSSHALYHVYSQHIGSKHTEK